MSSDLKIKISAVGAEEVAQALKSVQDAASSSARVSDTSIKSLVESVNTLNKAVEQSKKIMGDTSTITEAFSSKAVQGTDLLIKKYQDLNGELRKTQEELKTLTPGTPEYDLKLGSAAKTQHEISILKGALPSPETPASGGTTLPKTSEISSMLESFGRSLGLPSFLTRLLPGIVAPMGVAGMAYAGINAGINMMQAGSYGIGSVNDFYRRQYENAMGGDVGSGLIMSRGMGFTGEMNQYYKGGFGQFASPYQLARSAKTFLGGVGNVLTGNWTNPFESARTQEIADTLEADKARYGLLIEGYNRRLGASSQLNQLERIYGFQTVSDQLVQLTGVGGLSRENALKMAQMTQGYGGPGTRELGLAMVNSNIGGGMIQQLARLTGNIQGAGGNAGGLINQFSTGLSPFSMGGGLSQQMTTEALAQAGAGASSVQAMTNLGILGAVNSLNAFNPGRESVFGAAGTQAAIGVGTAQVAGVQTALDPRRVTMINSLVSQGLTYQEAARIANAGLTEQSFRIAANAIASKRGISDPARIEEIYNQVSSAVTGAVNKATLRVGSFLSAGISDKFAQAERNQIIAERQAALGRPLRPDEIAQIPSARDIVSTQAVTGETDIGRVAGQAAAMTGPAQGAQYGPAGAGGLQPAKETGEAIKNRTDAEVSQKFFALAGDAKKFADALSAAAQGLQKKLIEQQEDMAKTSTFNGTAVTEKDLLDIGNLFKQ